MTTPTMARRSAYTYRSDSAVHALSVGQTVRLNDGIGRPIPPGMLYRITGTLPPNGGAPQYRIRSSDERYERVAQQDDLQLAELPAGDDAATLAERTFGHG
jgi:hypothetical protein